MSRSAVYFGNPLPVVHRVLTNRGFAKQSALVVTETMSGQAFPWWKGEEMGKTDVERKERKKERNEHVIIGETNVILLPLLRSPRLA